MYSNKTLEHEKSISRRERALLSDSSGVFFYFEKRKECVLKIQTMKEWFTKLTRILFMKILHVLCSIDRNWWRPCQPIGQRVVYKKKKAHTHTPAHAKRYLLYVFWTWSWNFNVWRYVLRRGRPIERTEERFCASESEYIHNMCSMSIELSWALD